MRVPPEVQAFAARGPDWADFVAALPRLVGDLLDEWRLGADGDPTHGFCSLVLPVLTGEGERAVLKVGFVHEEAEHEHLALRHWAGRGAVRLLRADPHRGALLLERLSAQDLGDSWDLEACEVVAGLYARLHVPAPPQLRPLTAYVDRWTSGLLALPRSAPLPHRLVEQAVSLGRAFCDDPASTGTMVHCDLHYGNVLAGEREPWLAIDPKPVSGDPHYEPAPMLRNRWEELAGDVRAGVRRRFHALVDAAELDEDRARDWVVVRMLHDAMWVLEDADAQGRGLDAADRERITVAVAVAKAVQD